MIKNKNESEDVNNKIWKIYFNENIVNKSINLLELLNEYCVYFNTILIKSHFLLDMNKEHLSLLEKIVYDIAAFHFEKLNIKNFENKFVNFWFRCIPDCCLEHQNIHIDKSTGDKNCKEVFLPLITTLTYLCDHDNPTIITDIEEIMNTEKKYVNQNTKLTFSFPKPLKHLSCDFGKYYHGECHTSTNLKGNCFAKHTNDIKKRNVLALALWDKDPGQRDFYNNNCLNLMYINKNIPINKFQKFNKSPKILKILEKNEDKINIILNGDNIILNDKFYDNIINKNIDSEIYKFSTFFKKYKDYDTFVFSNGNKQIEAIQIIIEYNLIIKNIFTNNDLFDSIYNQYIRDKNIITVIDLIIFNFNGILFSLYLKNINRHGRSFTINNIFITNNLDFENLENNKSVCLILLDKVDELNNIVRGDVILNARKFTIKNTYYICYLLTINDC